MYTSVWVLALVILVHVAYSLLALGLFNKEYAKAVFYLLSYQRQPICYISVGGRLKVAAQTKFENTRPANANQLNYFPTKKHFWVGSLITNGLNPKATLFFCRGLLLRCPRRNAQPN